MQGAFFNLSEGERIVQDIKPSSRLRWFYLISMLIGGLSLWIIIFPITLQAFFVINLKFIDFSKPFYQFIFQLIFWYFISFLPIVFSIFFLSGNQYNHEYYWITNKRIVYKRGILGYRITSIPFERISDVMISRTFVERLFGFASLHLQTLAGQTTVGNWRGLGAEGSLQAIQNPEQMQELIFGLIKQKRREEHLAF